VTEPSLREIFHSVEYQEGMAERRAKDERVKHCIRENLWLAVFFAVRPLSITTAVQLLGKVPTGDLNVLAKLTPLVGHCKKRQQGSLGFQCALAKILETGMLSQFCLHRTLVTLKSGRRRTNKEQCTLFTGLTHCLMQTEFTDDLSRIRIARKLYLQLTACRNSVYS